VALILDTNALSAAADGEPAAMEVIAKAERLSVPVIVLGEYRLGIAQSRHRREYESWLQQWVATVTILEIDEETTYYYAAIGVELKRKAKPIPANDLWIASLCLQYALPVVSRDRHFDLVASVRRVDW
jgi:tRNA(fMet)-specific endonuclease VapC